MTKFSSNRPVKSTLIADQSLVKWAISVAFIIYVEFSQCDIKVTKLHLFAQNSTAQSDLVLVLYNSQ